MNSRQRKKQAKKRYIYWNGRVRRGQIVYRFRYYRMQNGDNLFSLHSKAKV